MLLHTSKTAPNPRRVHIFLAEKGIEIPRAEVDIGAAENRSAGFLARNPMAQVPVLELDDGSHLAESVAICRYFEELQPEPNLFGYGAHERARVEMWNRRMEHEIALPVFATFQMTHAFFAGRVEQVPDYGAVSKRKALARLAWLDSELAGRDYAAGDRFTIADITALCAIDFGRAVGIRITPEQSHLSAWHARVSARPSARA